MAAEEARVKTQQGGSFYSQGRDEDSLDMDGRDGGSEASSCSGDFKGRTDMIIDEVG